MCYAEDPIHLVGLRSLLHFLFHHPNPLTRSNSVLVFGARACYYVTMRTDMNLKFIRRVSELNASVLLLIMNFVIT